MTGELEALIEACEWFPSYYLILSENVYTPLLYYSYLGSLIPTLLIAGYVLINGAKELANRLLFLMSLCFGIWVFGAMVTWATEFPSYTMFFWTLINLAEAFVYFLAFYFFYVFVFKKDLTLRQKIIFSLPLLPTLALASTPYMLLGYNLSDCDRNAFEGILSVWDFSMEFLFAALIAGFAGYAWKNASSWEQKKQTTLLATGIIAFLLSFSLGNILEIFTENWYIGQYGLFGAPIFVAFLAYLIVRFKAFNLKLIGAQALVTALWLLVLTLLFVRHIENVRVVTSITLIFVLILGIILVRSVRKEVQQRELIQKQEQELEVVNKQQETLLHFISHEIKGYLTKGESAFSEIADGDYGAIPAGVKTLASGALAEMRKGVRTVMEILDASNLKKGTVSYKMQTFDLKAAVVDVVNHLKPAAEAKHIDIKTTIDTQGRFIMNGDEEKIRQHVLRNLIDNAIKYTPEGSISVELGSSNSPSTSLGVNKIRFVVKDSGVGITPEDMAKLFTEGGHGKDSIKVNSHSTGYGLFIAKEIVDAHGGKIWAESKGQGKGSRFIVELPAL
ncbi:MAG: HAMP domain-containing sensor histidine kinase [bacterium]|nr:HAMP domain-containing sensor histidine kinase [bacterium]